MRLLSRSCASCSVASGRPTKRRFSSEIMICFSSWRYQRQYITHPDCGMIISSLYTVAKLGAARDEVPRSSILLGLSLAAFSPALRHAQDERQRDTSSLLWVVSSPCGAKK